MAGSRKVLLVEDNPQIIDMYSAVLKKTGYDLAVSTNVDDALEQAKSFVPDVILLDIMLPGNRTGLDALMVLRSDPTYGSTEKVIIMLTNLGLTDAMVKTCEDSADGYVIKADILPHELPGIIEAAFSE